MRYRKIKIDNKQKLKNFNFTKKISAGAVGGPRSLGTPVLEGVGSKTITPSGRKVTQGEEEREKEEEKTPLIVDT